MKAAIGTWFPIPSKYSCVVTRTMGWARGSVEWASGSWSPCPWRHKYSLQVFVIRIIYCTNSESWSLNITRTMGWARDLWSGQADPDPHVHGETNIHYKFVVNICTNEAGQLDHNSQYPHGIHVLLQEQWGGQRGSVERARGSCYRLVVTRIYAPCTNGVSYRYKYPWVVMRTMEWTTAGQETI